MFRNIPTVTKNLLLINIVVFLAALVFQRQFNMEHWGSLHFFMAPDFHVWQFVTYQFLHGNFTHLFFNMFALWMFGYVLENFWGSRRFLFYYLVCGLGAGLCNLLVPGWGLTVGASGAVYGILLAFGMTFPNERIYLYFLMPIKAKWFVIGYAAIELMEGLFRADGVAHFAHLGGMLFGLLLILYWRKHPFSRF